MTGQNIPNATPNAGVFHQNLEHMVPTPQGEDEVDRRTTRWMFYAGDEPGHMIPGGLAVQSQSIPDRIIRRCLVTPCMTTTKWARHTDLFSDIIPGNLVPGSQHIRKDKAQEWVWAGESAREILEQYGNSVDIARQWGLVELKCLRGLEYDEVIGRLNITGAFFPNWPHDVPESNEEVLGIIKKVKNDLLSSLNDKDRKLMLDYLIEPKNLNDVKKAFLVSNKENVDIYIACAHEMIAAVEQAQVRAAEKTNQANIRIGLPDTDTEHKKKFDPADFLYSKRSGIALVEDLSKGNPANQMKDLVQTLADKLGPQQGVDAQMIATIAAATVAAMSEAQKTPGKKAA